MNKKKKSSIEKKDRNQKIKGFLKHLVILPKICFKKWSKIGLNVLQNGLFAIS